MRIFTAHILDTQEYEDHFRLLESASLSGPLSDRLHLAWGNMDEYQSQKTNLLTCAPNITKTRIYMYKFDPHKPHFCIVKLGLQGYTLFILFLLENIDCGYSLEPPRRGGSNEYPQSMFWAEVWEVLSRSMSRSMKKIRVFVWFFFSVFGGQIFYIFY